MKEHRLIIWKKSVSYFIFCALISCNQTEQKEKKNLHRDALLNSLADELYVCNPAKIVNIHDSCFDVVLTNNSSQLAFYQIDINDHSDKENIKREIDSVWNSKFDKAKITNNPDAKIQDEIQVFFGYVIEEKKLVNEGFLITMKSENNQRIELISKQQIANAKFNIKDPVLIQYKKIRGKNEVIDVLYMNK